MRSQDCSCYGLLIGVGVEGKIRTVDCWCAIAGAVVGGGECKSVCGSSMCSLYIQTGTPSHHLGAPWCFPFFFLYYNFAGT